MGLNRILVLGRDSRIQQLAATMADAVFAADSIGEAWDITDRSEPEAMIVDPSISDADTCRALKYVETNDLMPVIIVRDDAEEETVNDFLSLGAFACIDAVKGLDKLGLVVDRIADGENGGQSEYFDSQCPPCVQMVGKSEATVKALKMIRLVASSGCDPILVVGETGTGKEVAAQAIHNLRHGSDETFVAVNCAALTANLLESELFGHVKGSFTSAESEKTGLFEAADEGTIFLDEISEMPLELQAKLLRVIQEKRFRKVGGTKEIQCKATIIASSNRNLNDEVENGKFRRDLFYRLNVFPVALAPLRHHDRKDDIELLAKFFIENSTVAPDKAAKIKGLTKLAIESLKNHSWDGNVRELKNVIDRAMLLETTDKIGCSSLIFDPTDFSSAKSASPVENIQDFSLANAEKELIDRALKEAKGQKTRAAAMLGITRATLYAKVKHYNIDADAGKVAATA
ncbi:Formate hydrogenlyase transcriptional activator [Anaerohalosphaera lusitana]|uniref:Formate hydrogenlyase transcriptional activator n=1 Tax=Anaerohalosphaera lusitana TaxID=1936003 RepID=A0A1U9NHE4_9BACT|nr:sigma-54 dependent transcriptional regulator [Anaerohalosphaera lusitana]AQT66926.1 Formate hydrogenlyase transcriptional activator [Anaerohalosphaera lusitana]